MSKVYIALEAMGAVIVLLLLYANVFELKQRTRKRSIFTRLLVENEIVIAVDAISWLHLSWRNMPTVLGALIAAAYIVPLFAQATFSKYIYVHISEKKKTNPLPFQIIYWGSIAAGAVTLILCVLGKMFTIRDGVWYAGVAEPYYYLVYIAALVCFSGVIIASRKVLGLHDLLAALSFCLVPLCTVMLSLLGDGINLAVTSMAVDVLVIYIMLQSEQEKKLIYDSNNDELTGLLNRRAYEDSILEYPEVPPEPDFVYASVDVNGLKQVNDSLGHTAGDELICGAADCMKRVFGNYGRVFRTGGDEFVVIFFAEEDRLQFLMEDLETVTAQWSGKLTQTLSLSAGYASKREFPTATVKEMAEISDQRMYEAKERYYANRGVDRRGRAAAYSALCALYTKILKIDLTKDSYSIISMDASEQTEEKGFANTISGWLTGFGKSGQVHPEDLPE